MKKRLLILSFILSGFALNQIKAQDSIVSESFLLKNSLDRSFYLEKQLDIYTSLPTNLWFWDYEDYSVISFNGNYDKGPFKMVDEFNQNAQLSFKTSSIQTIAKNGWRFYGEFELKLSNHKVAKWNSFFEKSEIGSPFRIVTQRDGDYNTKHYGLSGIINKKLGEKLSLGVSVKYFGDLYLRTRDIRNEQYNLSTEFILSANYKFSDYKNFALGLSYAHKKSEPLFSAQFLATGPEFNMDILNGLGDFNSIEMSDQIYILNNNPKFYVNYFAGKKNKLSLAYSFFLGKELWKNKITSLNSSKPEEIYKYEYMDHEFLGSYFTKKENFALLNKLEARFIDGVGYQNRTGFQKTYIYTGIDVYASSSLLRHNKKLFHQSAFGIRFENISKKDMVYAHLIEYTNVSVDAKTSLFLPLGNKLKIEFELNTAYQYNLDYTHNVVSAGQKPYTINLGFNEVAYQTADVIKLGSGIRFLSKLKGINADITINYARILPIDVKFTNAYSLVEKTDFRNFWNSSINLYF